MAGRGGAGTTAVSGPAEPSPGPSFLSAPLLDPVPEDGTQSAGQGDLSLPAGTFSGVLGYTERAG